MPDSQKPALSRSEPRAVKFPQANFTYTAPPDLDNCVDLPCFRGPNVAISCWKFPSLWQRIKFLASGTIWFYCLQNFHPPVSISVDSPFKNTDGK